MYKSYLDNTLISDNEYRALKVSVKRNYYRVRGTLFLPDDGN
jgi:hypothetical protein